MNAKLDPSLHSWMTDARTRAVMRALKEEGGDARFVGGAVRNALVGEPVGDTDIATPVVPNDVMRRLKKAGLGAAPTGIEHGTITAIAEGKPFEVTTLRRDVETDGRRAVVAFTTDWKEDASRRDFTMNALYADEDGNIFDYFGGAADLRAGHVRFVGNARTRIREDYLRILRLFRFHAWYGKGEIDADALAASIAGKAGLKSLSGERVQKELLRLLEAGDPAPTLRAMEGAGILAEILPPRLEIARLERLVAIEMKYGFVPDSLLRLSVLLPSDPEMARGLAATLRFSNADRDRIVSALSADGRIRPALSEKEARKLLYLSGQGPFSDRLMLNWAGDAGNDSGWRALLALADAWKKPRFPLDGRDAKALGLEEGPKIGAALHDIEQWWIENDFAPDRAACLARLGEVAKKTAG